MGISSTPCVVPNSMPTGMLGVAATAASEALSIGVPNGGSLNGDPTPPRATATTGTTCGTDATAATAAGHYTTAAASALPSAPRRTTAEEAVPRLAR